MCYLNGASVRLTSMKMIFEELETRYNYLEFLEGDDNDLMMLTSVMTGFMM